MGSCLTLRTFLLVMVFLFSASCANKTLIRDSEYQPVYRTLEKGSVEESLLVFPKKEEDGFITTFEKTWIKFWGGEKLSDDDVKKVQALSTQIDQRKFVSISNEASIFLVGESEDGYIPSEHEIISLHLFLSMIYLDRKNPESAHVELKRAIEYLANNPDGKETTFDDAAIRIWLAGLWEAIGDRNASDVDLRKAMELSGNKLVEKLISQNKRKVQIIFKGLGPRTNWTDSGLSFFFDYHLGTYGAPKNDYEFSTRKWYDWHQNRNTKIRESLLSSHYMTVALKDNSSNISKKTVGVAATSTLLLTSVAVVVGGVYLGSQMIASGAGDAKTLEALFYLTVGAAYWLVEKSASVTSFVDKEIADSKQAQAELRKTYRMIRFLPTIIEYVDENLAKSESNPVRGYRKTLGAGDNRVEFIWNPE